jgi:hypothetical protein
MDMITEKAGPWMASRSLNVLKKSEKGPLTKHQRSFSFWKKSSARGQMLCWLKNSEQLCYR